MAKIHSKVDAGFEKSITSMDLLRDGVVKIETDAFKNRIQGLGQHKSSIVTAIPSANDRISHCGVDSNRGDKLETCI